MIKISLIISTYNWPEALRLCLESVNRQTLVPDEIIIPDDGSTAETANIIDSLRSEMKCPIKHVWHEDDGFRKTVIHNKAIREECTGDYLIFTDGDIIFDRHFVSDHVKMAEKGYFVLGSRVLLTPKLTNTLIANNSIRVNPFTKGVLHAMNAFYMPWLGRWTWKYRINDKLYGRGANMAMYLSDFKLINGFNEDMVGWGMEDTDMINRLNNNGIKRKFAKFRAIEYHLYHQERKHNLDNNVLLKKLIEDKCKFSPNGLIKY